MNILNLKKPTPAVSPQRQALIDNLQSIRDVRAKLEMVMTKDRQAQKDIEAADATDRRIAALREQIDQATADAHYNGEPLPDLAFQSKQLQEAETLYKRQAATARAAAHVRQRYSVDMGALHDAIRELQPKTTRLLWEALREDELLSLAEEFKQKEKAFLDVHQRAFAAATAVDKISLSRAWGQFVGSGNVADLHISRPDHPAFRHAELTPEQVEAERKAYFASVAAAADAIVDRLLNG